ncbi:MAG: hypothetical protein ACTSYH_03445 [Candidatus Heimdallarchaeaceae archaeon]
MSDAINSIGVLFKRNGTTLGEVVSIDWGAKSRSIVQASPDADYGYDEFVPGYRDAGSVSLGVNFTASGYSTINSDYESDSNVSYSIVFPDDDSSTFSFSGLVTEIGVSVPEDGKVFMSVTLKVTNRLTLNFIKQVFISDRIFIGDSVSCSNSSVYTVTEGTAWVEVADQLGAARGGPLVVLNNELYGCTSNLGALYKWNGTDAWTSVAPQLNSQFTLYGGIVYNDEIYVGTGNNGRLFKWNGTDAWIQLAPQFELVTNIYDLCEYNSKIYGGNNYGYLLEWNGVDAWSSKANAFSGQSITRTLFVYENSLYGGMAYEAKLHKWNDVDSWEVAAGQPGSETTIVSMTRYQGNLYGGTYDGGTNTGGLLVRWNDVDSWDIITSKFGSGGTIENLLPTNLGILATSRNSANLLKWNIGESVWTSVASQPNSDYAIKGTAVLDGYLYGFGSPSGKLYRWE